MRIVKTFTLDESIVRKIDAMAEEQNRNKSSIAESLIRRSLGEKQRDVEQIKRIEKEVLELSKIVKKIYNIPDIQD